MIYVENAKDLIYVKFEEKFSDIDPDALEASLVPIPIGTSSLHDLRCLQWVYLY